MLKSTVVALRLVVLAGCGGLKITSLTAQQAEEAHIKKDAVSGYIVYHPMLVVWLKKSGDACEIAGKPVVLPDYSKPFLLEIERGLARSSVELQIEDGWRLGGVKTEADNTALLKLAGQVAMGMVGLSSAVASADAQACTPGFYKLVLDDDEVKMKRLKAE